MLLRAFGSRECIPGGSYDINGSGKFDDVTSDVLSHLKKLSVSAVWYTGVISHATRSSFRGVPDCNKSIVKGEAGSPYAIRDWFDVDPALATDCDSRMAEFETLVERTHKAGMKVIIDFVPNHVFRQYRPGFFTDENYYILQDDLHLPESIGSDYRESPAKATGNAFTAYPSENDWYDTVKLNYDNPDTWDKMLDVLLFWLGKGVDGFRCDMVELVPSEFFSRAISGAREKYPSAMFIAEVYSTDNFRRYLDAGFDYLYDKSCFYDTIKSIVLGNSPASNLTYAWQTLGDLQPRMLNFLENHDEVRLASDFFAVIGKKSIAALASSLLFNTAPFMLYFGQEFGERGMESEGFSGVDGRTSIFDYCTVPSVKRFLDKKLSTDDKLLLKEYRSLLKLAVTDDVFAKGSTYDLMYVNPTSSFFDSFRHFAFLRGYKGTIKLVVANYSDSEAQINVNIPSAAFDYFGVDASASPVSVSVKPYYYSIVDL